MSDRISDRDLYTKLYNHNAYSKHPLDIDSLGAGGGMGSHLIFFGTQTTLGNLMTNRELWDLLSSIMTYEYQTTPQRSVPVKVWHDEWDRIRDRQTVKDMTVTTTKGGKLNASFTYDLIRKEGMKTTIKSPIGVWEK